MQTPTMPATAHCCALQVYMSDMTRRGIIPKGYPWETTADEQVMFDAVAVRGLVARGEWRQAAVGGGTRPAAPGAAGAVQSAVPAAYNLPKHMYKACRSLCLRSWLRRPLTGACRAS
jgi:hypothetical protein